MTRVEKSKCNNLFYGFTHAIFKRYFPKVSDTRCCIWQKYNRVPQNENHKRYETWYRENFIFFFNLRIECETMRVNPYRGRIFQAYKKRIKEKRWLYQIKKKKLKGYYGRSYTTLW